MSYRWQRVIVQAQKERVVTLGNTVYWRIPYGQERALGAAPRPVPSHPCRTCGVLPQQLHVPPCPCEQCPACQTDQRLLCEMAGCTAIRRVP